MKTSPLCIIGQRPYATIIAARAEAFEFWRCVKVVIQTTLIGCWFANEVFSVMWPG